VVALEPDTSSQKTDQVVSGSGATTEALIASGGELVRCSETRGVKMKGLLMYIATILLAVPYVTPKALTDTDESVSSEVGHRVSSRSKK